MEKWLFFIPVIKNPDVLKECINQLMYKRNVDIVILLNGADQDVKDLVYGTYSQYPQFMIWENKENVYVTEAWNSAMLYFKNHLAWDRLILMNSDLTMQLDFDRILRLAWDVLPEAIITPSVIKDKTKMYEHLPIEVGVGKHLDNPPGIFITLNHQMAEIVYPIPSQIRVWFNDSYLHQLLKAAGYDIITLDNLLAFHHDSTHINSVGGIHEIIEEDKSAWDSTVQHLLKERIKQLKKWIE